MASRLRGQKASMLAHDDEFKLQAMVNVQFNSDGYGLNTLSLL